ncbi:MAG: aminotransferase class IV [Cyanobacteriota bacterium]|nr:aminotransferase class IV [Cyanobacteriota bacterium]
MNSIAWIEPYGWGTPAELPLPADARGVLLAEGVFETVLVLAGRARLLEAHLARWHQGASLLGLQSPPELAEVSALVDTAIARSGIAEGALRLNWCRGSGPRGLDPADAAGAGANHLFWLQLSTHTPVFAPVTVIVSPTEVRSATSLLSRCKSFGYGSALIARRQAREAGVDDALLRSSNGDLCCGTSSNLLVRCGNSWLTPPLASGCLAGIMRQQALACGLATEAPLGDADLERCEEAVLLNSLGCRPIHNKGRACGPGLNDQHACERASALWHGLLQGRSES